MSDRPAAGEPAAAPDAVPGTTSDAEPGAAADAEPAASDAAPAVPADREPIGVTGAVIAGGRSRRMGTDKRGLLIDGVPMLRRTVRAVAAVSDEVVLACRPESPPDQELLAGLDVRLAFDRPGDVGPLGGVEAALRAARHPLVLVVAGDMPWVEPAVLAALVAEAWRRPEMGCVALATERGPEPLAAVYRRDVALPAATRLLDAGRLRMHGLPESIPCVDLEPERWRPLDSTGRSARNVNEAADLA